MSIVWTLRKYVDPIAHRHEEAERERDRKVARRQGLGEGDDGDAAPPEAAGKLYECRVCGQRCQEATYCPDCLADTMVEVGERD